MANRINPDIGKESELNTLLGNDGFLSLDRKSRLDIVNSIMKQKQQAQEGGWLGKILGTNTRNAVIHVGLIICIILVLVLVMDCMHAYCADKDINMDLVDIIIPVITLYLGYIFGKGPAQDE